MQLTFCLCLIVLHAVVHADHLDKSHHHHHDHDHHGSEKHNHTHHEHGNVTFHMIASANAEFAFKLYHEVASTEGVKNIFMSPVSISTAFAMLSLGAKSKTYSQITETLGFNQTELTEEKIHDSFHHLHHMLNDPNSELYLNAGNAVFMNEKLKLLAKFSEDVKHYYESEAFTADFKNTTEAIKQINDYVEKQTHGKIVNLMKKIHPSSLMVLINYIYFKGKWAKPFDADLTKEEDFHVDESTVVRVPMMTRSGMYNMAFDKELHSTVIRLPYKGDASAILILPKQGKMKEAEAALSMETTKKWRTKLQYVSVDLSVPKFFYSATMDLHNILPKMGMTDVFSDQADLSGITGHRDLKVSQAVHKAVLNFDETGTEAAGATASELMPMSVPRTVEFNHPFLFFIYHHRTHSILFIGKVVNPTEH